MPENIQTEPEPVPGIFFKDTVLHGRPAQIKCFEIAGQCYCLSGRRLIIAQLEDIWFEEVSDPSVVDETLRRNPEIRPDLFTFRQRVPDVEARYPYHQEWTPMASLPVKSFDDWWTRIISYKMRKHIRRSERRGLECRVVAFDDDFVQGMTGIFNETPVRQGRPFYHYGKDAETVKRQFSRFIQRQEMIGAYYEGELIGFLMLGFAGNLGEVDQLVSYVKHRDKLVNNALIAKAVEVCEQKELANLGYGYWTDDSLSDFKGHCGFRKIDVPTYYIPYTLKGKIALKLGLHRGWRGLLPKRIIKTAKRIRRTWSEKRAG